METGSKNISGVQRITEGIIPGYKREFKKLWDKLLWEPELVWRFRSESVKLKAVAACWRSLYVDQDGVMRDFETYEEAEIDQYVKHAQRAEDYFLDKYRKQLAELKSDPEGRDIIWRPGNTLLTESNITLGRLPIDKNYVTVRARYQDNNFGLYCPDHVLRSLILVGNPDQESVDEGYDYSYFLACSEDLDNSHLKIPVNTIWK